MTVLNDLLRKNIKIPSPPEIALRLLEALKKEDFSFGEVARIIQSDPALTTKVLTVVNSSFYSLPGKVSNIERALTIMGVNAVKNIALSFILIGGLKWHAESAFDFNDFWKKSITAAVAAEIFAAHLKIKDDDTFVTSLLQDIGILVMFFSSPDDYLKFLDEKNVTKLPVEAVENRIFCFNHQEVGSEILELWGVPENIYMPIRHHHMYWESPEQFRNKAKILFLSDKVSALYNETQHADSMRDIVGMLKDDLGISESSLKFLVDEVANKSLEIYSYFEIVPGDMKPFSQLLQEANEELSNLNLTYETLLVELKQEKMLAERLAQELVDANNSLREMSFRDYLTGLYNRRYLYDFLEKEISRSQRFGRCFSVLVFDIDYFKKLNDTYGHHVGDLVLKTLSEKAEGIKRETDIVARYGGEEFVMVLPETELERALIVAERLRMVIEDMDIAVVSDKINVTVSVGVAAYSPQSKEITIDSLIDSADKALYDAKNSGRNKVVSSIPNVW